MLKLYENLLVPFFNIKSSTLTVDGVISCKPRGKDITHLDSVSWHALMNKPDTFEVLGYKPVRRSFWFKGDPAGAYTGFWFAGC